MPDYDSKPPRHPSLLDNSRAALLIIDIQTVLLEHIWQKELLVRNTGYMIEIARIHSLPVILTEHNPDGLGHTDEKVVKMLNDAGIGYQPLFKNIFSCCGHEDFVEAVKSTGRDQIIVTGMESHICVNQTALDLMNHGFQVHVVEDAVRARWENSHNLAIEKMRRAGAIICDWEMAAYELTYGAKTPQFKQLLALMKKAASDEKTESGVESMK
ncbi:MAG TPA: isochorismatase family protein [Firmicutes bacterium]|nr:isochorismatase family protein [Bacillota bacterium]